tara:strand:- start:12191 stop:12907 length:717 start_codon:yes stop_codon:yes gene_type:complete
MKNILEAKNLIKTIREKTIIDNISLEVQKNKIVGLLGPNGAGKTSTFYIIAGLTNFDSGIIKLQNQDVSQMPLHERSKVGLAYLPQESSIFPDLTVQENILGIRQLIKDQSNLIEIDDLIDKFNLTEVFYKKGRVLSGGERRKTEIARTLIGNPSILLLDEPFAGIDPIAVDEIKDTLGIVKNLGISVLITDHNVRDTLQICDSSYILSEGKIVASGSKNEIINDPIAKEKYFGKTFN